MNEKFLFKMDVRFATSLNISEDLLDILYEVM